MTGSPQTTPHTTSETFVISPTELQDLQEYLEPTYGFLRQAEHYWETTANNIKLFNGVDAEKAWKCDAHDRIRPKKEERALSPVGFVQSLASNVYSMWAIGEGNVFEWPVELQPDAVKQLAVEGGAQYAQQLMQASNEPRLASTARTLSTIVTHHMTAVGFQQLAFESVAGVLEVPELVHPIVAHLGLSALGDKHTVATPVKQLVEMMATYTEEQHGPENIILKGLHEAAPTLEQEAPRFLEAHLGETPPVCTSELKTIFQALRMHIALFEEKEAAGIAAYSEWLITQKKQWPDPLINALQRHHDSKITAQWNDLRRALKPHTRFSRRLYRNAPYVGKE